MCSAGTRPLAWMDVDGEPYHVLPHHLEANTLARATERSALGLPPLAATLAGAGGCPSVAIFGALSSLL